MRDNLFIGVNTNEMKEDLLEQCLKVLAARPIPPAPSNLASSVLREIRLRQHSRKSWAEAVTTWLWQAEVALASVPAAAVMGIAMALIWPAQTAKPAVSRSLYLDVFSQYSPTLPSTYISLGR